MAQHGRISISRRDFGLALASLIGGTLLLEGCSGDGADPERPLTLRRISGSVVLPPGLDPATVMISSSGGLVPLSASAFAAQVQKDVPSLVIALHSDTGKVILMGMIDPSGSAPVLDSTSTAVALMYLGMGGASFSGADRAFLLNAVRSSAQVSALASAIQAQHGMDPFALNAGGEALKTATKGAILAFNAGLPAAEKTAPRDVAMQAASSIAPLLLIEPANEVDGFTAVQTNPGIGFKIQNKRRRSGVAYTYMVGHTSDTDVNSDETPPRQIGQPLYIPSTKNILSLPNGWSEVVSDPVALSISGSDKKTRFEAVVLATAFGASVPAFYSDPRYSAVVQTWRNEAKRLRQATVLQGLSELVLEVIGLGGTVFTYEALTSLIPGIMGGVTSVSSGLAAAAEGNIFYEFVLEELLTSFTAEAAFALELPMLEPLIAKVSAQRAAEMFAANAGVNTVRFARAALVVLVVLGVMELADVIAVSQDTGGGEEAKKWALTAFQPTVQLTPPGGMYTPGEFVTISASSPGVGTGDVTYQWSLSGSNLANLSDGTKVGASFTSTKSTVTLGTTPSTQGDLVVMVRVRRDGAEVGIASATFTRGSGAVNLFLETYESTPPDSFMMAFLVFPLPANPPSKYRITVGSPLGMYNGPEVYEIRPQDVANAGPEMPHLIDQQKIYAYHISGTRNDGWWFYKRGGNLYMYFDNFRFYEYAGSLVILGNVFEGPRTVEGMQAEMRRRADSFTVLYEQTP